MTRAALSVKTIQTAKPASKEYLLTDGEGLYLRVLPSGRKNWVFIYSVERKRRKIQLGDAADLTLAQARDRAQDERLRLSQGRDPQDEQVLQRDAQRVAQQAELQALSDLQQQESDDQLTLSDMVNAWLEKGVARADDNKALRREFDNHLLPKLGGKLVSQITEDDLREVLRGIGRGQGKNRTAVALLTDTRQMFLWAEKRRPWRRLLVEGNPAELVEAKQVVSADYDLANECDRVLSRAEIVLLRDRLQQLHDSYEAAANKRKAVRPIRRETELALWIMLSTCSRVGELASARWENIDLKAGEWLVPRLENKTKRNEWMVFLSPFALSQFKALHEISKESPWCFPARGGKRPLNDKTFTKQVGDRQVQFKKRKELKGRRNDNALVLPGGEWTPHDLRRTGSTLMQSLGVLEHVRDRCLNHVVGNKIRRVYGRYHFAAEKRAAWQLLGSLLEELLATGSAEK